MGLYFLGNPALNWLTVSTYWAMYIAESQYRVTSFLVAVGRVVRMMLSAGFIGNAIWSYDYPQLLIRAFWPQPINLHGPPLRLAVSVFMTVHTHLCLRYPYTHARRGSALGHRYHLFIPLYGLRTSRYRRDDAVTPASGERDLHRGGGPSSRLPSC